MIQAHRASRRRGAILPMLALVLPALMAFLALAIDLGLIAVAKNQLQNAADAAAMGGARTLDGSTTQNRDNALTNATTVAQANLVLNQNVPAANITVTFGSLHYDDTNDKFTPVFNDPAVSPDILNLCQVTISHTGVFAFAKAIGFYQYSLTATAIAAHRPKDVVLTLDFSGSMNNESDLWNCEGYLNGTSLIGSGNSNLTRQNTSNNTETVYPKFGHYASEKNYSSYANYANLLSPAADSSTAFYNDPSTGISNMTITIQGVPALVKDFYSNNHGSTAASAFTSQPDSYATTPGGDTYLFKNGSTTVYAATVADILGVASTPNSTTTAPPANCLAWEQNGYKSITGTNFNGYTIGPRYWGKTFYIWPPDPTNDWRTKFFFASDGVTPLNNNTKLFTGSGTSAGLQSPPGNYVINYKAILSWIKNTGTNPFPSQLRSGGVLFYDSIPDDVPTAAYTHSNANTSISWPDLNQRFWKEYIDYVIGVWRSPDGNGIQAPNNPSCSIGPDYTYAAAGTPAGAQSAPPSIIPKTWAKAPYMSYTDNPPRPRHRFWFGPMTMIQFMMDTGTMSGAVHDISMYPMKQGIASALLNMKINHPSYRVALCPWNRPVFNNDPVGCGSNNGAIYDLGNDFTAMAANMWVPRIVSTSNQVTSGANTGDVRPWQSNGNLDNTIPRAHGDYDGNTASQFGLMMAYNQLSTSKDLQNNPQGSGGFGRKKAGKLVIFETDGMYNQGANPTLGFQNKGAYQSYFPIRYTVDTVNTAGSSSSDCYSVTQAICNKTNGTALSNSSYTPYTPNPGYPGYSTNSMPAVVHCIGFGVVFQIDGGSGSAYRNSLDLVQNISKTGGTVFPDSSSDAANGWKWCIGTLSERQTKIKQAISNIFEKEVPLALIK